METEKSKAVTTTKSSEIVPTQFDDKIKFFLELTKSTNTGIKTVGEAILVWQKAKELGIGWGNALPHMHVINGKPGIDIHIIKALLSRPKSGIVWEHTEDNVPIYQYYGEDKQIYQQDELPPNYMLVNDFKADVPSDRFKVAIIPTNVEPDPKKTPIYKKVPVNYRSTYIFTRKKKDIDDTWITVTEKGTFSWQEALVAKLPTNKQGEISDDSAWTKYRKLMINTRAFTYGAREIASDLMMGNYEVTELLDMSGVKYDVTEDKGMVGEVTILDKEGKPLKK